MIINDDWRGKEYAFFSHKRCEAFPCHKTDDLENFNCLFCYCPLYLYGGDCGGNFRYTPEGLKVCSSCMLPHNRGNYGYIVNRLKNRTDKIKPDK